MRVTAYATLAEALGLKTPELVALVGGGGKTAALHVLARERTTAGDRVVATTTTAMFLEQLQAVGPTVIEDDAETLIQGLARALDDSRVVAAARSYGVAGKVVGLTPAVVDQVWAEGLADCLLVEADGSRGRSLKAFGPHEPQLPSATTTAVLVAGVDVVGEPLTDAFVHRAGLLASVVGRRPGSRLTVSAVADALREQVRQLRRRGAMRVVALLNKAEAVADESTALDLAAELLGAMTGSENLSPRDDRSRPEAVVMASLRQGRYADVSVAEV